MDPHSEIKPPALTPGRFFGMVVRGSILAALVGYSSWVLGAYILANVHLGTPIEAAARHRG